MSEQPQHAQPQPQPQPRDGYLARWQGHDYLASTDGTTIRLYRTDPAPGFDPVPPAGRYVRVVPAGELEQLVYEHTLGTWRGQPFKLLMTQNGWLRVEYLGGQAPVAEALGLELLDRGVYQAWAPAHEVTDIRVERVT